MRFAFERESDMKVLSATVLWMVISAQRLNRHTAVR